MSSFSTRLPRWLSGVVGAALLLYFFGYDLRQRSAFGGAADNTEALEIGARALLEGHDPYAFSTHLGNPIGPLMGGLILAVPLYFLMSSLFIQLMLAWAAAAAAAESLAPRAGLAVILLFAASPWSRATMPYLNDNGLTALGIVAFGGWGYWLAQRDKGAILRLVWTLGFACALDYRWTMWLVAVPYGALFLRQFGWRKATSWLVPVLLTTLALFLAPIFFPGGGYRHRTLVTLMGHSDNPLGTLGSVVVLAASLVVLATCSTLLRTIAGVWATMSVTLAVLLVGLTLLWLPGHTLEETFFRYHFYWYLGWVLVFGIAALVTPTVSIPASRSQPSALAREDRPWWTRPRRSDVN